jgi:hypothetical protein
MKTLAGVIAITAACGGGGPAGSGPDAAAPDFTLRTTFSVPEIHLAVGDIDGDGDADLYLVSDASGASAQDKLARNDGAGTLVLEDGMTVDQDCTRPRLENIDQDGFVDVVCVPAIWGGASARLNQAGASFVAAGYDGTPVAAARAWPAIPSSIIAATSQGLLALSIDPAGTQMAKSTLAPDDFETLAIADLDGDGAPELIAGTGATWSVFSGADRSRHDVAGAAGELETVDLDRDGHPDLVSFGSQIGISLVRDGAPTAPTFVDGPPIDGDHVIVDYDGDGAPDLLFVGVGPQVYVMRGTGTGSLNPPEALLLDGAPLPAYMPGRNLAAAADFDRDGRVDLAISDVQTHTVRIWFGQFGG